MEKINNRRKAVVYVSNGYDFNPFPDARAGGGIMGSNQFNNSSYQEGDMFNMDRRVSSSPTPTWPASSRT